MNNPPDYRKSSDYVRSCANCRFSRFIRMNNGDELRCTRYDFSFGNTNGDLDPQDVASEYVCNDFKR